MSFEEMSGPGPMPCPNCNHPMQPVVQVGWKTPDYYLCFNCGNEVDPHAELPPEARMKVIGPPVRRYEPEESDVER
jgi:DNA-directed RNA polymerase subunit RPC12/RpoP